MQKVIVKTYKGKETEAMDAFRVDSNQMAALNYYPTSQSYAAGSYGCAAFIGALLLCLILVGVFVFIYMLIVKPDGVLSVTYEYRPNTSKNIELASNEKTCPMCAEKVKQEAKICRFCGHKFDEI